MACGPAGNTPVVIIQQASEKRKLLPLIQNLDLHEIHELSRECLRVLRRAIEGRAGWIYVRNNFFSADRLVNCDLSSAIAPSGSRNRRATAVPTPVFDREPSSMMQ